MDKKTAIALERSIEHWEENAKATLYRVRVGEDDCALCGLFFHFDCVGCPVSEKTGLELCKGSPYAEAADRYDKWWSLDQLSYLKDECNFEEIKKLRDRFRESARKEIEFLKSLRVKDDT